MTTVELDYQPDLLEVLSHAPRPWRDEAEEILQRFVATGRVFTSDNLREAGLPDPTDGEPNRWGALIQSAMRRGLIEQVGVTRSTRRGRHGARIGQWKGVA